MLGEINATATIGVKSLEVARDFYENKLGLKPMADGDYSEVKMYRSGNTEIEVYESEFAGTNQATVLTWTVKDIAKEVKELKDKGINFEHYDFPDTKMEGDVHVMGKIKAAWFKDPDGNIFNIVNQ